MKDSKKRNAISWGIFCIAIAVISILIAIGAPMGFLNNLGWFKVVLTAMLVAWIFSCILYWRELPSLFIPLAFLFVIFEPNIAKLMGRENENLINDALVIVCGVLLSIGTKSIVSAFEKKDKKTFSFTGTNNNDFEHNHQHANVSSSVRYINCEELGELSVSLSVGCCDIYFENVDKYNGDGTLMVYNSTGSMKVHVPEEWHIDVNIENNIGRIDINRTDPREGKTLHIKGKNSVGRIQIL